MIKMRHRGNINKRTFVPSDTVSAGQLVNQLQLLDISNTIQQTDDLIKRSYENTYNTLAGIYGTDAYEEERRKQREAELEQALKEARENRKLRRKEAAAINAAKDRNAKIEQQNRNRRYSTVTGWAEEEQPLEQIPEPSPMSDEEAYKEILLRQQEQKSYMPDDVFKDFMNTNWDNSLFSKIKNSYNNSIIGKIANGMPSVGALDVAIYMYNKYLTPDKDPKSEQQISKFYQYTPEARQDAYNRYIKEKGISPFDVQSALIKKNNPTQDELALQTYHSLMNDYKESEFYYNQAQALKNNPLYNNQYGFADWTADAKTRFLANLNETQRDNYLGRIIRSKEMQQYADTYKRHLDNMDELREYQRILSNEDPGGSGSDWLKEISNRTNAILQDEESIKDDVKKFESYIPKSVIDEYEVNAKNYYFVPLERAILSGNQDWSSGLLDDVDAARAKLTGLHKMTSSASKKNAIDKYIKTLKDGEKFWEQGAQMNQQEMDDILSKHTISGYFDYWDKHASGNLLDYKTWLYKQPGFIGSSSSSFLKQLPGYALAITSMMNPEIGAGKAILGGGINFFGAHSAAIDENNAEVAQNYRQKFKNQLQSNSYNKNESLYDKFIKDGKKFLDSNNIEYDKNDIDTAVMNAYLRGQYIPADRNIYEQAINAAYKGADALFEVDMRATDTDNWIDTALMFTPTGALSKLGKAISNSRIGKNAALGMTVGVIPAAGAGLITAVGKAAEYTKIGKQVSKDLSDLTQFIKAIPSNIYRNAKKIAPQFIKTNTTRNIVKEVEDIATGRVFDTATQLSLAHMKANAKQLAGRLAFASASEGIEEGKQYLHGREYILGDFDNRSRIALNDLEAYKSDAIDGFRSAYVMMGVPFGLDLTTDSELIENIKGGMLGGLFHVGVLSAPGLVKQTFDQKKADDYVLRNIIADKIAATDRYQKNIVYADKAKNKDGIQYVQNTFGRLLSVNDSRKGLDDYIPRELLENQWSAFNTVVSLVNNPDIIKHAESLGIDYDSPEFNKYIAVLEPHLTRYQESSYNLEQARFKLVNLLNGIETPFTINEDGSVINSRIAQDPEKIAEAIIKPQLTEEGKEESAEQLLNRKNNEYTSNILGLARIASIKQLLDDVNTVKQNSNFFGNSEASINFMEGRLTRILNDELRNIRNKEDVERIKRHAQSFLKSIKQSDDIVARAKDLLMLEVENDYDSMMYQLLSGKLGEKSKAEFKFSDKFYHDAKDVIKAYEDRIKGDDALFQAIEEDFLRYSHNLQTKQIDKLRAKEIENDTVLQEQERAKNLSEEYKSNDKIDLGEYIKLNPTKKTKNQDKKSEQIYKELLQIGKDILSGAVSTRNQDIHSIFKQSGHVIPKAFESSVMNLVKQVKGGEITPEQFANVFIPAEDRMQMQTEVKPKPKKKKDTTNKQEQKPATEPIQKIKQRKDPEQVQNNNKEPEIDAKKLKEEQDRLIMEEHLREMKRQLRSRLNAGIPIDILIEHGVPIAVYYIERGYRKFIPWSKKMIEVLGEEVRECLKQLYMLTKFDNQVSEYRSDMDSEDFVIQVDVYDLDKKIVVRQSANNINNRAEESYQDEHSGPITSEAKQNTSYHYSEDDIQDAWDQLLPQYVKDASDLETYFFQVFDDLNRIMAAIDSGILSVQGDNARSTIDSINRKIKTIEDILENHNFIPNNLDYFVGIDKNDRFKLLSIQNGAFVVDIGQGLTMEIEPQEIKYVYDINGNDVSDNFDILSTVQRLNYIQDVLGFFKSLGMDGSNASVIESIDDVNDSDMNSISWKQFNTTYRRSIEQSHAIDNPDLKLSSVSTNDDFIVNGDFELIIGVNDRNKPQVQLKVTYNNHEYTPIDISIESGNHGIDIFNKIVDGFNRKLKVRPVGIGRSFGIINYGEQESLIRKGLIREEDLYNVEFSNNQDDFLLIKRQSPTSKTVVATKPGSSFKSSNVVYIYRTKKRKPLSGLITFLTKRNYLEVPETERYKFRVPVVIKHANLTEGDARTIVNILKKGKGALDNTYSDTDEQTRRTVYKGLTNRQVINLLFPIELFGRKGKDVPHLDYTITGRGIHLKLKRETGEKIDEIYYFDNPLDMKNLELRLTEMSNSISQSILTARFGDVSTYQQKDNPIKGIKEFIMSREGQLALAESNGILQFGESRISFTMDDFKNPNDKSDVSGISGLGWYIKNGFLTTAFEGFEDALINFKDVEIENPDIKVNTELSPEEYAKQDVKNSNKKNLSNDDIGTDKVPSVHVERTAKKSRIKKRKAIGNKISNRKQEKARELGEIKERLSKIINVSDVDIQITEDVLDDESLVQSFATLFTGPAHIVGKCYSDAIMIYKYAKAGVEYHEAFHRIAEVLMSEKERNAVYNEWKKYRIIKKDVAEGIADSFMYYMKYKEYPEWAKISNVRQLLNKIGSFVRVLYSVRSKTLYKLFTEIQNGSYRDVVADKEQIKRFESAYKDGMNYTVGGVDMPNVLNHHMYRTLRKSLVYFVYQANDIDISGDNIQSLDTSKEKIQSNEQLQDYLNDDSPGARALQDALDNWDNVVKDVASDLSQFGTDYKVNIEQQDNENKDSGDNGGVESGSQGEHMHSSYEFSQFSRSTSRVRFFFSRVQDCIMAVDDDAESKTYGKKQRYVRYNELGLPQFLSSKETFNRMLNACWNCNSFKELIEECRKRSEYDATFQILYDRLNQLYNDAYKIPLKPNVNSEALLTSILKVIRANKQKFIVAKSNYYRDDVDMESAYTISLEDTSLEYNAREYRREWSETFAGGGSIFIEQDENGKYIPKGRADKMARFGQLMTNMSLNPKDPSNRLGMAFAFSDYGINHQRDKTIPIEKKFYIRVNGQKIAPDVTNPIHLDLIKDQFILMLNAFGIQFNKDMLNYMLESKYQSSGWIGMREMFNSTDKDSINAFVEWLQGTYYGKDLNISQDGKYLNGKPIENIFSSKDESIGFVNTLADFKYAYRHANDQLMVYAVEGNQFYVMSENNIMSDRLQQLQRYINNGHNEKTVLNLMNYSYNYLEPELELNGDVKKLAPIGSVMLKSIQSKKSNNNIGLVVFSGMKSSKAGDRGTSYDKISSVDDTMAKMHMLLEGKIIFPTMSDKKTWVFIEGFEDDMPGIHWNRVFNSMESFGNSINVLEDGTWSIKQRKDVIDQLLEYFITEHRAVAETIRDINNIKPENKISNYHQGGTIEDKDGNVHRIVQGARHAMLHGVYVNGKYVSFSNLLDENGKYISDVEAYNLSEKYFFAPQDITDTVTGETRLETSQELYERQSRMIEELLHKRLIKEMARIKDVGMVSSIHGNGEITDYSNIAVDKKYVNFIYKKLLEAENKFVGKRTVVIEGQPQQIDGISREENLKYRSMAIAIVINDQMVKAIVSKNEILRVFAGHPAFFKYTYSKDGKLLDTQIDFHKRAGGLVSTGANNVILEGMPEHYVCAEVDNEMIQTASLESLSRLMYEGKLRQTYVDAKLQEQGVTIENDEAARKIVKEANETSLDDIRADLANRNVLDIAEKIAKNKADSFKIDPENKLDGVDVADGAAYISDEMAENLIRMNGDGYNEDVARAFRILRGQEINPNTGLPYTTQDILETSEAYELIRTKVIGSQKYTAYGFRDYNGPMIQGVSNNVQVAYYNKMALFPMFKIISTGKMAKLYEKMKSQSIDMLMINSAVKVGSQGSKPIVWDDFSVDNSDEDYNFTTNENGERVRKPDFNDSFYFNTYIQDYQNLRKQFNTDPKEDALLKMGTQMTKVVMECLTPGMMYKTPDGRELSGKELRDSIFEAIRGLSNAGYKKLNEEYMLNGELNVQKFSDILVKELQTRGADQQQINSVRTTQRDGKTELNVGLYAQSNANWIQSILNSIFNKDIIDINTPGKLFIQRSIWNLEGPTSVYDDEGLPTSINNGKPLEFINEEGSMDCLLSADFFDDIVPLIDVTEPDGNGGIQPVYEYDIDEETGEKIQLKDESGQLIFLPNGKPKYKRHIKTRKRTFEETEKWLIKNGIISGYVTEYNKETKTYEKVWKNAKANIVGYRIPTQAISSIHALRCVGIIPVIRDTVILPKEFTKITGADFDIDKLFLSTINYKVDRKTTNVMGTRDYSVSTEFEEGSNKYLQNILIYNYLTLLTDLDENGVPRHVDMLHGPIDSDTKLLKDVINDLESGIEKPQIETFDDYVLSQEIFTKNEYIKGKNGIGPFALNNNNHILTTLFAVKFAKGKNILSLLSDKDYDHTLLYNTVDRYGNSIMSWLSGLINAHVDIAKDSFITRMNVNEYTYNLVNLLIRTGFGKTTFYFMTQPILKQLAQVYVNTAGVYNKTDEASLFTQRLRAEQQFIISYVNENMGTEFTEYEFEKAIKHVKSALQQRGVDINSALKQLFSKDSDVLRDTAKSYIRRVQPKRVVMDFKRGHEVLNEFDVQMLVYIAKQQFDPYSQALSDLVKYSKIDTKKQGNNIVDQYQYEQGFKRVFLTPDSAVGKLFDRKSLTDMCMKSYIYTKTMNAIGMFRKVLSDQLIQANEQFNQQIFNKGGFIEYIGREENATSDLITKVINSALALIKSKYINNYAKHIGTNIKDLVSGNNTIYDRLLALKVKIKSDPNYSELLDEDGEILNPLLKSLVSGNTYNIDVYKQFAVNIDGKMQYTVEPKYVGMYDTYTDAKFIRLLNMVDDDQFDEEDLKLAWSDMLYDSEFPDIQKFAKDLIVYAFVVSGDTGGVRNLFNLVPDQWRLDPDGDESYEGYERFMHDRLVEYKNGSAPNLNYDDIVLNNWTDDRFIRKERLQSGKTDRFKIYRAEQRSLYPILLGGYQTIDTDDGIMYKPTYGSEEYGYIPQFFKTERSDEIDELSQRRYNVYKLIGWGYKKGTEHGKKLTLSGEDLVYPIYILVQPKGNVFTNGNFITEYGRDDSERYEAMLAPRMTSTINAMYKAADKRGLFEDSSYNQNVFDLLTKIESYAPGIIQMSKGIPEELKDIILDAVQYDQFLGKGSGGGVLMFKYNRNSVEENPENLYIFTDNTDRTSGTNEIPDNSWYSIKYGTGKMYPNTTSAQIRGLNNARPISTQRWYHDDKKGRAGNWTNADIEEFKSVIDAEYKDIEDAWNSGLYRNIVLPVGGIAGTEGRITNLQDPERSEILAYLQKTEAKIYKLVLQDRYIEPEQNNTNTAPANVQESDSKARSMYRRFHLNDIFPDIQAILNSAGIDSDISVLNSPFNTVEGAYQAIKMFYSTSDNYYSNGELTDQGILITNALYNARAAFAKTIGDKIVDVDQDAWNEHSDSILKLLINESRKADSNIRTYKAPVTGPKDLTSDNDIMSQINEKGEEIYSYSDLRLNMFDTWAEKYKDSKDFLRSVLNDFIKDNPLGHYENEGEFIKMHKIVRHYQNRWIVNKINSEAFYDESGKKKITAVEYTRTNLHKWLINNDIPGDFIQVTDGGLVRINQKYVNPRRIITYIDKLKQLGAELIKKCN